MKTFNNITLAFLAGIALTLSIAFKSSEPDMMEVKITTADVEQMNGLYVFIHSKPVKPYETLGTYAPKVVWSDESNKLINHMVTKGKEKFPEATAIIFTSDDLGTADLIKFK